MSAPTADFRAAYAAHRAAEGRAHDREAALALPYLTSGPFAKQWGVRARTFDAFLRRTLRPLVGARTSGLGGRDSDVGTRSSGAVRLQSPDVRVPRLLDLGAGNGWLCHRATLAGCACVALDLRDDAVDGLGAAAPYLEWPTPWRFARVAASFDAIPLADASFDVVVFNASLHYAADLAAALGEARRVTRRGGRVVVLDSPFYRRDADGAAMVAEKRRDAAARFGARANVLLGTPAIEYLTARRLADASRGLGLAWRRRRVAYPLWYELRPLAARLRGRRAPSRFDLWEGTAA